MPRNSPPTKAITDPRWVTVQMQIRVPWWRREQLIDAAKRNNVSLTDLLADALDRVHPPIPPER
jgi:hypothetical protein